MAKKDKQDITDTEKEIQDKIGAKSKEDTSKKKQSAKKSKHSKQEELKNQVNEINDKYLRLYSEFDNYRKRTIKERIELSKTASEDVIIDLLPVMDDFERAIKSNEESEDCEAIKDGINLIFTKFKGTLEKKD